MTRVAARGAAIAAIAGEIITFDTSTVIEHRQLPTTPSCTQPQPIVRDNLAEHNINLSPKKLFWANVIKSNGIVPLS